MFANRKLGAVLGLGVTGIVLLGLLTLPSVERSLTVASAARQDARAASGPSLAQRVESARGNRIELPDAVVELARRGLAESTDVNLAWEDGIGFSGAQGAARNVVFAELGDARKVFVLDIEGGDAPLTVVATDLTPDSDITGDPGNIMARRWSIYDEDGVTLSTGGFTFLNPATGATTTSNQWSIIDPDDPLNPTDGKLVSITFDTPGEFWVELELLYPGQSYVVENRIQVHVTDPGEIPTASIALEDLVNIHDGMGLVPANDWVPLFAVVMSYAPDSPAPRVLTKLSYRIMWDRYDQDSYPDRPWDTTGGPPDEDDLLEFGLFRASGENYQEVIDDIMAGSPWRPYGYGSWEFKWDSHGYPYDTGPSGDVYYALDFATVGPHNQALYPGRTYIPIQEWPMASADPGTAWIVAVRTSPLWSHAQHMCYMVSGIVAERFAMDPVSQEWAPIGPVADDDYSPDPLSDAGDGVGYSSDFFVIDMTGYPDDAFGDPWDYNQWNWPNKLYTPVNEHVRPRWDVSNTAFELVTGEWLDLRRLFSLETWTPLLGISAHGTYNFAAGAQRDLHRHRRGPLRPAGERRVRPNRGTRDIH